MLRLDRTSTVPLYQQIYAHLAAGIENGTYPAGKKLPSIRECARELDVSNTTIELAYQRLVDEGFATSRRGSGYIICKVASAVEPEELAFSDEYNASLQALLDDEARRCAAAKPQFDFAYDAIDSTLFPYTTWSRISREVFLREGSAAALQYNDPQGLLKLREQIAHYLTSERGVTCIPEQIIVMPTTRDLLSSILALFDPRTTTIAMEDPGYDEVFHRLGFTGFSAQAVPMVPLPSWEEARPYLQNATIVFATPASQFPTNIPMPTEIRKELVEWADEADTYVIDDEYGWEFGASGTRLPSLATFDRTGRVITLGSFSNAFTPSVCLSYAVLPPQLMLKWRTIHTGTHPQVPWQTQAAMASFMAEDYWRTHIRRIRTAVGRKRELVTRTIQSIMGDAVDLVESTSSLFVLVQTRDGRSEQELIETAAQASVCVYPTSQYWHGNPPEDWRYVLVGFASIREADITPGLETLAKAWGLSQ